MTAEHITRRCSGLPLLLSLPLSVLMAATLIGRLPKACTALLLQNRFPPSVARSSSRKKGYPCLLVRTMASSSNESSDKKLNFGPWLISKEHVFHTSSLSAAFVNLRPLVPGHVLVMSLRVVPLLADLSQEEYTDLWLTVRVVQDILKQHYTSCQAFNVAVQDGRDAGQSVPHVHVHILPRKPGDYERNDDIYDDIQNWAPRDDLQAKEKPKLDVPDDADRKDRTTDQMADEAKIYRTLLASNKL
ncbi:Nitrilase and fragile histidine triad fusion protein NitFhit [Seminavis robusta]|uniref:Bis(5'-adenosyl)-triphosphatase n=1 Tax=Seminavis robusta TaxID=568900 RepID=A0A9N8H1Z4_9STRA|nr:Nitrilase and fragile histidine triad fusion protein NitFhit [Seminavis robusta]|eukprot:Sro26_g017590.1 Nitrilase and fragile histidine triad fusion protein NitFhit (245) ;mRNA; r:66446-67180